MVKAKKKIKKTFAIHHWCGLMAGIFLLVISLTGSILVFDDDIDNTLFAKNKKLLSITGFLLWRSRSKVKLTAKRKVVVKEVV